MAILLILWIIQAGVGLAIGRAKGRPGLGLLLGALLGVFGWIALAFVGPASRSRSGASACTARSSWPRATPGPASRGRWPPRPRSRCTA